MKLSLVTYWALLLVLISAQLHLSPALPSFIYPLRCCLPWLAYLSSSARIRTILRCCVDSHRTPSSSPRKPFPFPIFCWLPSVVRELSRSSTSTLVVAMETTEGAVNTIETMRGADWDDRIALQDRWSNTDKGWRVQVVWKQTPFGVGLFANEDIEPGTLLREGKNGRNLMQFRSVADIEAFCNAEGSDAGYRSRVGYVSDYLWGFDPNDNPRGHEVVGQRAPLAPRFFGMWIPGNGLNHRLEPNTVYRPAPGGTDEGIDLIALTFINKGDELFDDYRRHGKAPAWLVDFARREGVTLNFAGCNEFVIP